MRGTVHGLSTNESSTRRIPSLPSLPTKPREAVDVIVQAAIIDVPEPLREPPRIRHRNVTKRG
ncbi:hypothetical protein BN2476_840004 [Paraburkholderia piptadeniae]|uniref:Uncharacterized protein n=1 Tax=Paraburkholderia piptadeniae TaxID=1701573 RepID=A0A1N7SUD1_9BURK|nr:hypothetical protein BN2476_840004 [Paraburkholderia piptadeniae]